MQIYCLVALVKPKGSVVDLEVKVMEEDEGEILCVSPLAVDEGNNEGREETSLDWLVTNIKELLDVVGVFIVGREDIVLEFLSSILWKGGGAQSARKGPVGKERVRSRG